MNILIIVLSVIGGIIALVLILGLIAKKGYSIQRDIIIDAPKQEVFDYIKHIKNQDHFSKWVMTDPNMKKTFVGIDGTVGFIYGWEGNKQAGKGEQEIKGIKEGERLDLEVRFEKPFVATALTPFTTEAISADQTKVTWSTTSAMKYPMNAMMLFMNIEGVLGKDMETSLNTLKGILEKK